MSIRSGTSMQRRIRALAENLALARVDRDHAVAGGLQLLHDAVRRLFGIRRGADHRDGRGVGEELLQFRHRTDSREPSSELTDVSARAHTIPRLMFAVGHARGASRWRCRDRPRLVGCSRPPRLAADLVITRANIWTGNPAQPSAMAVAVIGDRIVDVGGADEIERWRGANTTVLDAEGRRLIPGSTTPPCGSSTAAAQLDERRSEGRGDRGGVRAAHQRARQGEAGRVDSRRPTGTSGAGRRPRCRRAR